jgi:transposase
MDTSLPTIVSTMIAMGTYMMDVTRGQRPGAGYADTPSGQGASPRRQYTVEFKRRIVEQTLVPGASVAIVARQHELNANQVFEWRKRYREGRFGTSNPAAPSPGPELIRVGVINHDAILSPPTPAREAVAVPSQSTGAATPGRIEIELPNGIKLRARADIDLAALRRILAAARELA